jgi:pimeloyl-ACP methyl ester carboxylesterase
MPRQLTELEEFLVSDYEAQCELLSHPSHAEKVRSLVGAPAFEELRSRLSKDLHLGSGHRNMVFVPGVMGSTLQSNGLGGVWWMDMMFARDKLNGLALVEDGTNDADTAAEIGPGAVDISYVPFRRAIAESNAFGGSVAFPYDWRKPLALSTGMLRDRILKCRADSGEPVHVVGHSMGGLMIRTALMLHGDELWPAIGKVVFIGTPHYGSPSIAGYLKNHLWGWEALALVGMYLSRETFRSLYGVLSLLPAPRGVYPGTRNGEEHPCANFDMYDASAWELDIDSMAKLRLQAVLEGARKFHVDLRAWHESLLQEYKDRMLMIVGVGQETLFRLEFSKVLWGAWEHTSKVTGRVPGDRHRDGDQRVPVASAELEDVPRRYVCGVHGGLTNIPAVIADVIAWCQDEKLNLPDSANGALGGHLSGEDWSSQAPALDGSGKSSPFRSLPEYENPTPQFRADIEKALAGGMRPEANLARIL